MATTEEQNEQVYQGIVAVAAHCDGARSLDYVGFDGQDTHYGRRVASVPFSAWTDDVKAECARIANKYREQILRYTGTDVSTLDVVKEAVSRSTNHAARNDARAYEKRAKHLAARTIDVADGRLGIRWASGDPDFSTFLPLVQALPGRRWDANRRVNVVDASPQVEVFVNEHDFTISPAAQALLTATPVTPAAPKVDYQIWLGTDGRIVIKTALTAPGQPASDAVRALPGRAFVRSLYANSANPSPQVLAFARTFKLNVSPEAVKVCEAAGAALGATDASGLAQADIATVLNAVSRCGKPENLPAAFVLMLAEILP
jgi:hypothetical protein